MSDTLDSLHREFALYRQAHRRGAYPLKLRQRAIAALPPGQLLQLAARLGLTAAQISRWEDGRKAQDQTQGFFEVTPKPAEPPTVTQACSVEVEMRGGATIRLRGKIEPELLAVLVEALQQRVGA